MVCGQDFGITEKTKKKTRLVSVPSDWLNISANASGNFIEIQITTSNFISLEPMTDVTKEAWKRIPRCSGSISKRTHCICSSKKQLSMKTWNLTAITSENLDTLIELSKCTGRRMAKQKIIVGEEDVDENVKKITATVLGTYSEQIFHPSLFKYYAFLSKLTELHLKKHSAIQEHKLYFNM
jgi:hypothetical protein